MSKISGYSENTNPSRNDFALGEIASGPTTNRFKYDNVLKLAKTTDLSNPCKFFVYYSGGTNPNGVHKIALDNELYDAGSDFDSTTNYRFVAPVTGSYHFDARARFFIVPSTYGIIDIYLNGTEYVQGSFGQNYTGISNHVTSVASTDIEMTAGDYVEIFYECTQGSTFSLEGGTNPYLTSLSGRLLSTT